MRRILLILLLVAAVLCAGAFFGGPWLTFRALRAAAVANDPQGLAQVIDYDATRAALRTELGANASKTPPPSLWQDPVGAIGRMLGQPFQALNVDIYITPQALADLSNASADKLPKPKGAPFMAGDLLPGLHGSTVDYWDPGRTRIAVRGPGDEDREHQAIFTFERRSLFGWKLVHLRLPTAQGSQAQGPKA
jgi:hypothetical protein